MNSTNTIPTSTSAAQRVATGAEDIVSRLEGISLRLGAAINRLRGSGPEDGETAATPRSSGLLYQALDAQAESHTILDRLVGQLDLLDDLA